MEIAGLFGLFLGKIVSILRANLHICNLCKLDQVLQVRWECHLVFFESNNNNTVASQVSWRMF